MRRLLPVPLALLALAPSAAAQVPSLPGSGQPPSGQPQGAAAPTPAPGTMRITVSRGFRDGRARYVAAGQRMVVIGRTRPFVAGQTATIDVFRNRRRSGTIRVPIRRSGNGGYFRASFPARRPGSYTVRARHDATPQQQRFEAAPRAFTAINPGARYGSRGKNVRILQLALRRLGYLAPLNGRFDWSTGNAVFVFRKVNGMRRNSAAGRSVFSLLLRGRGGFKLRDPKAGQNGKHVEFDYSRQVLVLARKGRAERIYHTSSGARATPTIYGKFRVYRKDFGYNSLGMLHSVYFIRGYAIHGLSSVPTYPASHGCLRVYLWQAYGIYRWLRIGDPVITYP